MVLWSKVYVKLTADSGSNILGLLVIMKIQKLVCHNLPHSRVIFVTKSLVFIIATKIKFVKLLSSESLDILLLITLVGRYY